MKQWLANGKFKMRATVNPFWNDRWLHISDEDIQKRPQDLKNYVPVHPLPNHPPPEDPTARRPRDQAGPRGGPRGGARSEYTGPQGWELWKGTGAATQQSAAAAAAPVGCLPRCLAFPRMKTWNP